MKKVAMALGVMALLAGCGGSGRTPDKPLVFVSIPPQAHFVEQIAAGGVDVRVMLPPGSNHHTYDPKPSQMRDLSRAAIYVRIGLPFELASWDKIMQSNPSLELVDARDGIALLDMDDVHADESVEHAHETNDPHIWLDPKNVQPQARAIAEALTRLDPSRKEQYERNQGTYLAELEALDRDVRSILSPVRGRAFWVYHPAWAYFAQAYGLKQCAIEQQGKQPGTQALAELVKQAKADGARVIFVDPQFDKRNAEVVAREVGAEVQMLDPLAKDYEQNLRHAAKAIAEALR